MTGKYDAVALSLLNSIICPQYEMFAYGLAISIPFSAFFFFKVDLLYTDIVNPLETALWRSYKVSDQRQELLKHIKNSKEKECGFSNQQQGLLQHITLLDLS
jgi:hypothetical protein